MFHGPRYAGVAEMGPMGARGVDGVIEVLPAPGALLDCAGQLMGWWVMATETRDRLAMPVHIRRIALFGSHPAVGQRVACRVRIDEVGDKHARADLELAVGGRVWAAISGWEDRRFDSDDAVWDVLMYPERHALAVADPAGFVSVTEHWRGAASRELMVRRYLGERERGQLASVGIRGQRGWFLGRIAIKDAVRLRAWHHGRGPMYPIEVQVDNLPSGQPTVGDPQLAVSVAHKDDRAVAIVGDRRDVGIDLEKIEPRTQAMIDVAFTADELARVHAHLATLAGAPADAFDEWLTRLWAAKEAIGKARGTGVRDPRKLEVRAIDGDQLAIDDELVATRRDGAYVIAWTTLGVGS